MSTVPVVSEVKGILILVLALVLLGSVWWIKHRLDKADEAIAVNAAMSTRIDKLDKRAADLDAAMQDRQDNATSARDYGAQQVTTHRELHNEVPSVRSWDDGVIPGELRARSAAARRQRDSSNATVIDLRSRGDSKAP